MAIVLHWTSAGSLNDQIGVINKHPARVRIKLILQQSELKSSKQNVICIFQLYSTLSYILSGQFV